jgi:xanthine permease XanP
VAATGIRIVATQPLDRRAVTILAVSLATGLGVTYVPEARESLPPVLASVLGSGIATGGLVALVMNLVLPRK